MSKHYSLTVSLPESLGDFIQQRVSAGRYPTASDVVMDALGVLRDREQTREDVLAEIREQIEVGARQAEAGLLRDGREMFENIRRCRVKYPQILADHRLSHGRRQAGSRRMDTVRVIHDREGQTLTVWFGKPSSEVSSSDNEHGVIVMKDQACIGPEERGSCRILTKYYFG